MFAIVLCQQQTVHNEHRFSAQGDSQVYLVQHSIIDFWIVSQWTCFLLWSMFVLKEELNCLPTIT